MCNRYLTLIVVLFLFNLKSIKGQQFGLEISEGINFYNLIVDKPIPNTFMRGLSLETSINIKYEFENKSKFTPVIKSGFSSLIYNKGLYGGYPIYLNLTIGGEYIITKNNIFLICDLSGHLFLNKPERPNYQKVFYSTLNVGIGYEARRFSYFVQTPFSILPIFKGEVLYTLHVPNEPPVSQRITTYGDVFGLKVGISYKFDN